MYRSKVKTYTKLDYICEIQKMEREIFDLENKHDLSMDEKMHLKTSKNARQALMQMIKRD